MNTYSCLEIEHKYTTHINKHITKHIFVHYVVSIHRGSTQLQMFNVIAKLHDCVQYSVFNVETYCSTVH